MQLLETKGVNKIENEGKGAKTICKMSTENS